MVITMIKRNESMTYDYTSEAQLRTEDRIDVDELMTNKLNTCMLTAWLDVKSELYGDDYADAMMTELGLVATNRLTNTTIRGMLTASTINQSILFSFLMQFYSLVSTLTVLISTLMHCVVALLSCTKTATLFIVTSTLAVVHV